MSNPSSSADHPPHRCLVELLRGLREQQSMGTLCDVVVKGCEESALGIPCHRNVLSVHSAYFRTVFTQDWKDSSEPVFQLRNIDSRTLNQLVKYAYTLIVDLNDNNVERIVIAAQFLQMGSLELLCWDYVEQHMRVSNYLAVHTLASNHHHPRLAAAALELTLLHFLPVAESQDFLELDAQQLIALLASDNVDVFSEDQVLQAVLRWLDHDRSERLDDAAAILQTIRVAFLSEQCRQDYSMILTSALKVSPPCPSQTTGETTPNTSPRASYGAREVILCLGGTCQDPVGSEEASVDVFCPSIPAVWRVMDLRILVECCSAALLDPGCILINSMHCVGRVRRNSRYTGLRHEWRETAQVSTLRQAGALASLNGRVYAAGGFDPYGVEGSEAALSSVETYDPVSDSWSAVAALPVGLSDLAMVACEGRLYAFGGYNAAGVSNAVFSYDPAANAWSRLADMPTGRSGCRACVAPSGLIYVTGGETGDAALRVHVEAYDRVTDRWHKKGDMLEERTDHECVCVGGRLYVMGGFVAAGMYQDSIEVYDEATDSWALHECRLPQAKSMFGCVVMKLKRE
ncbi:kelch-like protein 12 [Paramacrobiotus metropolitanus]|uniref:kelch-like protein 12 n=1 Tax=Paramacrobiotus metropolitanus TaxID=2943436 RepID=UPI002445E76C|nr:kelch-like protein 12 [Paramacrobiotus metropolitanus]